MRPNNSRSLIFPRNNYYFVTSPQARAPVEFRLRDPAGYGEFGEGSITVFHSLYSCLSIVGSSVLANVTVASRL